MSDHTAWQGRCLLAASGLLLAGVGAAIASQGCKTSDTVPAQAPPSAPAKKPPAPAPSAGGENDKAVQEPITGKDLPTIILTQAWFWTDAEHKPHPGPARMQIWRQSADGWQATRLEDPDSNVFHKSIFYDGGILTIGAEKAMLKVWRFADGKWTNETLWQRDWGGKYNRLRDVEIGDVNGNGQDEIVMATHDAGVVAVYEPSTGKVTELDEKPDTFVHEIEIGDIDGDGKNEFFATPSDRNKANASQKGMLVMYRWNGKTYQRSIVDPLGDTHAKEILAADIDGDGRSELFASLEAQTDAQKKVVKPVEIREYHLNGDGTFSHTTVATIDDRQNRFLVAADFDGDGYQEIIASAMKSGIWLLDPQLDAHKKVTGWTKTLVDSRSSGFEHAAYAADLGGDGNPELYVAADDQHELAEYTWNASTKNFDKKVLGRLEPNTITWNIATGRL